MPDPAREPLLNADDQEVMIRMQRSAALAAFYTKELREWGLSDGDTTTMLSYWAAAWWEPDST